ncbi:MAG: 50S ribosomal protein L23 [Dehalococcoidales bacterium]|jgi:large subunit ribosomal protein L23|nr:50S ribosomal protein L23 [Dehalococcoidales bacterium]RLC60537.1 MAG: 50S ribosomal protein L23 [Chloroflexota bacterium]
MHPYEVLRRPVISEKATLLQEGNKYVFEVAKETNKVQIKQAVELAFKVKVSKVNVITIPGKTKRMGRREVTSSPWKKAVITLGPGDKISFFEGV